MKKILRIESAWVISGLFILSLFSTAMTLYYSYRLNLSLDENIKFQENRTQSILLADELRQSSDDLTNFARMYAITEEIRYKLIYNRIIDIRNGKETRPPGYQEVYWDLEVLSPNSLNMFTVIVDENGNELGEKISIDELMLNMGMDKFELEYMHESKLRSDSLAIIEMEVFNIIENTKDWRVKSNARKRLFDKEYLLKKSNIMIPIKKFYSHVDTRTKKMLKNSENKARSYLIFTIVFSLITFLMIGFLRFAIYVSRKKNKILLDSLNTKNTYLEHAAKIIRHDMHSGINTYIPRGISSLNRRIKMILEKSDLQKIESPMKLLSDGLLHTQKVYKSVYAFTDLVKKDAILEKTPCDIKDILESFLKSTSYKSQVKLHDNLHKELEVNEWLFCTAIDNLIRNGLKYNDSQTKQVDIYREEGNIIIQDNGRGMTQREFKELSLPYARKENQKEQGMGLGLNICTAILEVHGFKIKIGNSEIGTKIIIKVK